MEFPWKLMVVPGRISRRELSMKPSKVMFVFARGARGYNPDVRIFNWLHPTSGSEHATAVC